jgi:hypothetical protein
MIFADRRRGRHLGARAALRIPEGAHRNPSDVARRVSQAKPERPNVAPEITADFRAAPTNELPAWLLLSAGAATFSTIRGAAKPQQNRTVKFREGL